MQNLRFHPKPISQYLYADKTLKLFIHKHNQVRKALVFRKLPFRKATTWKDLFCNNLLTSSTKFLLKELSDLIVMLIKSLSSLVAPKNKKTQQKMKSDIGIKLQLIHG